MNLLHGIILLLALCLPAHANSQQEDFVNQSTEQLIEGITAKHPVSYLILAGKLMQKKKYDEAIRWYYIGQIRYRAYLEASPNLDPSGDPALYGSLKQVLGTQINQRAGCDMDNWVALVDGSLDWHQNNANLFTPKKNYPEIYQEIEDGFGSMRAYIQENKDKLRQQRKDNGLKEC